MTKRSNSNLDVHANQKPALQILKDHTTYKIHKWNRKDQLMGHYRSGAPTDLVGQLKSDSLTVWIGAGLPRDVAQHELEEIFKEVGTVANVRVIQRGTSRPSCFFPCSRFADRANG